MHLSPILPTWPHEMYGTIKSNSSLHSHTHAHLLKTHHKPHYATHLPSQRWLTFLYFVSFMLRHWRAIANMTSCFRCCLVLCMVAFMIVWPHCDSPERTFVPCLWFNSCLESKFKTTCILENVRGPSLACTMVYVSWSYGLCENCVALHNCFLTHALTTRSHSIKERRPCEKVETGI